MLQELLQSNPPFGQERAIRPVRALEQTIDQVFQIELSLDRLAAELRRVRESRGVAVPVGERSVEQSVQHAKQSVA